MTKCKVSHLITHSRTHTDSLFFIMIHQNMFLSHKIEWKECLFLASQVYTKHPLSFFCFSVLTFFSLNKPIFQLVLTRRFPLSAAHFWITTTMILTLWLTKSVGITFSKEEEHFFCHPQKPHLQGFGWIKQNNHFLDRIQISTRLIQK